MKIRTQFIMTMLLFGAVLAAISASAIVTNRMVETAGQQENIADSIVRGASELSYLANDYVIYRESQQLERWQTRFAAFSSDVSKLNGVTPEQQVLVSNIQANTRRLKDVFDSVVSAVGGSPQVKAIAVDSALLQVSWSRMAVQSQSLVSDASRLSLLLHNRVFQLQRINIIVIIALIGVLAAYFLANYLIIQRRTLKSIAELQAGTAVIGSGNLSFKIEEKKNDEIGDLSRAFNKMTTDLKTVTASKTDLEREIAARQNAEEELRTTNEQLQEKAVALEAEIEERKQAEAALRESEEKYRNLFSTMSEGFGLHEIILDVYGKPSDYRFLELNDAFEKLTGLSRQRAIGRTVKEFLPGIEPYWIEAYGSVALTGQPVHFENYSAPLGKWYGVHAYSPAKNQFAVLFTDITERKQAEESLKQANEALQVVNDELQATTEELRASNEELRQQGDELQATTEELRASNEELRQQGDELQDSNEKLHQYREHLEELVAQRTKELRDLAHRLVDAQEKERNLIGKELHDEIGQYMTYATLLIDKAMRKQDQELLAEAKSTVQQAISQVRNLSSMLSPRLLKSAGLLPALASHIEEYTRRTGIKVSIEHSGMFDELPEDAALTIYRIVQESLTNVLRHANASNVVVHLSRNANKLYAEVADDGSGFNPDAVKKSTGLTGMKERALALGGTLAIHSAEGKGTRVTAEILLPEKGKA